MRFLSSGQARFTARNLPSGPLNLPQSAPPSKTPEILIPAFEAGVRFLAQSSGLDKPLPDGSIRLILLPPPFYPKPELRPAKYRFAHFCYNLHNCNLTEF
jgi:hypothetical protein